MSHLHRNMHSCQETNPDTARPLTKNGTEYDLYSSVITLRLMYIAAMNISIDDDLKARSGCLRDNGIRSCSPRSRYVVQNNRLAVQVALLADEDADIIELAGARLVAPCQTDTRETR